MIYSDEHINFNLLPASVFEELCFDLLTRLGFQSLNWRQGGADAGRDIEGRFKVHHPLVGEYSERWFFECKNYSNGVPVEKLTTKFAWADVEKPDHLVFFLASYPTNDCREWLIKKQENVTYKAHVIEGKEIKRLVLLYSDLVERYFVNQVERLLRNSFIDWVVTGLFPDPSRLLLFSEQIDIQRLTKEELALLLSAFCAKLTEINTWEGEHRHTAMDFSPFIEMGYSKAEMVDHSVLENIKYNMNGRLIKAARSTKSMGKVQISSVPVIYLKGKTKYLGHYATLRQRRDSWIEILLGRNPTTGEIEVNMNLFQPDGKKIVHAIDMDLIGLDLSKERDGVVEQGFTSFEMDISNST